MWVRQGSRRYADIRQAMREVGYKAQQVDIKKTGSKR